MVIMIAPIGTKTDHVKTWLREETRNIDALWLIHSKKSKENFPIIAKKLRTDLLSAYAIKIDTAEIDNPLSVDSTIDVIHEIISKEEEKDHTIIRQDFAINITGGTNAMGAAALIAATIFGTKAYYVREPQKGDSKGSKYVDELPVFPIGIAKLNDNQLKVLKIISQSTYEIEGGPTNFHKDKINGSISRTQLLEELGWDKKVKAAGTTRKEGNTRLLAITKKLLDAGLISKIPYTEKYVNIATKTQLVFENGFAKRIEDKSIPDRWVVKRNDKEIRFEITAAGKRQARDSFMF
jgi:hypothetical protein